MSDNLHIIRALLTVFSSAVRAVDEGKTVSVESERRMLPGLRDVDHDTYVPGRVTHTVMIDDHRPVQPINSCLTCHFWGMEDVPGQSVLERKCRKLGLDTVSQFGCRSWHR